LPSPNFECSVVIFVLVFVQFMVVEVTSELLTPEDANEEVAYVVSELFPVIRDLVVHSVHLVDVSIHVAHVVEQICRYVVSKHNKLLQFFILGQDTIFPRIVIEQNG